MSPPNLCVKRQVFILAIQNHPNSRLPRLDVEVIHLVLQFFLVGNREFPRFWVMTSDDGFHVKKKKKTSRLGS